MSAREVMCGRSSKIENMLLVARLTIPYECGAALAYQIVDSWPFSSHHNISLACH